MNDDIIRLQKRLSDLKTIKNSDTAASFKEAVQTQEMIQILEIQIAELQKNNKKNIQNNIRYMLSTNNDKVEIILTYNQPDPFVSIYSINSPFGEMLLQKKIGEQIEFKGKKYIIEKITN
jgi:transcription elongation GreA/GreB family factor